MIRSPSYQFTKQQENSVTIIYAVVCRLRETLRFFTTHISENTTQIERNKTSSVFE